MEPKKIFTQTSKTKPIPTYRELLACRNTTNITALITAAILHRTPTKKLDFFTVLQPSLSNLLFDEDDLDVTQLLLKFIQHINPPIPQENESHHDDKNSAIRVSPLDDSSSTDNDPAKETTNNNPVDAEETTPVPARYAPQEPDTEDNNHQTSAFYRNLLFL